MKNNTGIVGFVHGLPESLNAWVIKTLPKGQITLYECPVCSSRYYDVSAYNFCPCCRHQKKPYTPKASIFVPDYLGIEDPEVTAYSEVD